MSPRQTPAPALLPSDAVAVSVASYCVARVRTGSGWAHTELAKLWLWFLQYSAEGAVSPIPLERVL